MFDKDSNNNIFSQLSIIRDALLKITEEKDKNVRNNREEIINLERIIDGLQEEKRSF